MADPCRHLGRIDRIDGRQCFPCAEAAYHRALDIHNGVSWDDRQHGLSEAPWWRTTATTNVGWALVWVVGVALLCAAFVVGQAKQDSRCAEVAGTITACR